MRGFATRLKFEKSCENLLKGPMLNSAKSVGKSASANEPLGDVYGEANK